MRINRHDLNPCNPVGGLFADWRAPAVIRVAPVPLYNSFADIHRFVEIFDRILREAGVES